MASPVRFLVPMAHVKSVPTSIAFYRRLGFEVENTFQPPQQEEPSWANLRSDRAQLMVARAEEPVIPASRPSSSFVRDMSRPFAST